MNYFKNLYELKYNKVILKVDKSVVAKLNKHKWPGNIRELQHIVEKAVILCDGNVLNENDFWFGVSKKESMIDTLDLSQNEKRIILKAIEKNMGNYSNTAKDLGVSRKTLYNKMKKYGLE